MSAFLPLKVAYNQVNVGAESSNQDKKRKAKVLQPEISQARVINPLTVVFLFDKKIRPSNVSGHNGIIIPKVHSEQFISKFSENKTTANIVMDDMDVEKVWTFRLRDTPNGRFRKYVLEGIGKYIAAHGAKAGDYLLIYKDPQVQQYAIGLRKQAVDIKSENPLPDQVENVNIPGSDEVAIQETCNNPLPKEVENILSDKIAIEGIHDDISPEEIERIILLARSFSEVAAADDFRPQSAPADETGKSIQPSAVEFKGPKSPAVNLTNDYPKQSALEAQENQSTQPIDEEYVRKNFNMTLKEFIHDFNPFDFPPY